MCGICGIFGLGSGVPADPETVRAMNGKLRHRGPDSDGFRFDGDLGLGMRRLSILDLEGGSQPIGSEDGGVWTVFNGEIYNFRELRHELESEGHRFRTRTDTEVVVHAWEQWGRDALARLNGMFGLAVWEAGTRRLTLARDPFGIKPLYWTEREGNLVFASEVRALFAVPGVTAAVDPEALDAFLAYRFVPSPRTIFRGIRKLRPGWALEADRTGVREFRFARGGPARTDERPESELLEELDARLAAAVRRQLVADVPVGLMLSGGLDSALIAHYAARAGAGALDTFTVGFGDGWARDERAAARETARRIGSRHHEIRVTEAEFVSRLAGAVVAVEEPVATTSALPFWRLCGLAHETVKVALSGQGADEPFCGYPRHLGERAGEVFRRVPQGLRRRVIRPLVEVVPGVERWRRAVRSLDVDDVPSRLVAVYSILDDASRARVYHRVDRRSVSIDDAVRALQSEVGHLDPLCQMAWVDARFSLPDNLLLYTDKLSMAESLETRVPFLDLELMAFAESLPASSRVRGREGKYLLRRLAARVLPAEVLARPKIGFETPVGDWFRRGTLGGLVDRMIAPGSACSRWFDAAVIEGWLAEHRSGRRDHAWILFAFLTFELWHRAFIDREPVP